MCVDTVTFEHRLRAGEWATEAFISGGRARVESGARACRVRRVAGVQGTTNAWFGLIRDMTSRFFDYLNCAGFGRSCVAIVLYCS